MSYCKREGKDKSVFITREDAAEAAVVKELVEEEGHGIILPNGDINWDCPCLGGMAKGTCGQEFKDAFSCFHYSQAEVQGSDCLSEFRTMQSCFLQNPEEYGEFTKEEGEGEEETASEPPVLKDDEKPSKELTLEKEPSTDKELEVKSASTASSSG